MKINKLKGVLDYYGEDSALFNYVESISKEIAVNYGYSEVKTPIIEAAEVFLRTIGDESDIVGKEMYLFKDRGDRNIALKPESTASIMRMVVENKLYVEPGLKKFFYCSPNFRYDRPQAGRYRQFYQFGIEAMGVESPYLDAEVISMGYQILQKLGISKVKVCINTLGSSNTRKRYVDELKNYFSDKLDQMCEDCKRRYKTNTLRMLDCKADANNTVLINVPKITSYLDEEDAKYFDCLLKALKALNVPYEVNPTIVRGLDYYTNDIFEIIYDDESSPLNNLALIAGGRYNNLGEEFDGPNIPSIGFGMGMERIMGAIKELGWKPKYNNNSIVIITMSEEAKIFGLDLASKLRSNGYVVNLDYVNTNLKPQFKLCDRLNPKYIFIIGDDEIASKKIKVKISDTKEQFDLELNKLNEFLHIECEE